MTQPRASTVALITGASRGIGRAIAETLAQKGLAVGLVARDATALDEVRRACLATGARAAVATADVTDPVAVSSAVESIRSELGPIDLLVNNAGRVESTEVPIWEADPDDWWDVIETDLRGPFLFCRAVLPEMVAREHGRIVNITSGAAIDGRSVYSAYSVAKTALLRLTGSVLAAGAEHGIRAFDLAPGVVVTDMTRSMPMHEDRTDWAPVDAIAELIAAVAAGRVDSLSGRYLRASADDLDDMLARADQLAASDSRTLRLRPYGPDDPLA
jgi:3-oxoacyl-[acyl-carrier protein] reductase